jgi:hypothetical protein
LYESKIMKFILYFWVKK